MPETGILRQLGFDGKSGLLAPKWTPILRRPNLRMLDAGAHRRVSLSVDVHCLKLELHQRQIETQTVRSATRGSVHTAVLWIHTSGNRRCAEHQFRAARRRHADCDQIRFCFEVAFGHL